MHPAPDRVGAALRAAAARLAEPEEAAWLLAHVLGRSRAWLFAHDDAPVDAAAARRFAALVERRRAGEPVAYLTGTRGFWRLDLEVNPAVLIPRPETELLVELALARLPPGAAPEVADLGTGSGAVALALAGERPRARITATDASAAALAVARRNAAHLNADNVAFLAGDWWQPLAGRRFDLVVSNPPYVAAGDPHLERGDLRHEPRAALAAGADGLDALRVIIAGAPAHLRPGAWLLLEHGWDQGAAVRALLVAAGLEAGASWRDLQGHERVSGGRLPAADAP